MERESEKGRKGKRKKVEPPVVSRNIFGSGSSSVRGARCRKTQSAYLRGIIKSARAEWSNPPGNGKRVATTTSRINCRGLGV